MKEAEAEEWIVNLIRNARLDAKIDSKEGHVVMASPVCLFMYGFRKLIVLL